MTKKRKPASNPTPVTPRVGETYFFREDESGDVWLCVGELRQQRESDSPGETATESDEET